MIWARFPLLRSDAEGRSGFPCAKIGVGQIGVARIGGD